MLNRCMRNCTESLEYKTELFFPKARYDLKNMYCNKKFIIKLSYSIHFASRKNKQSKLNTLKTMLMNEPRLF